jgi:hypothetical protein
MYVLAEVEEHISGSLAVGGNFQSWSCEVVCDVGQPSQHKGQQEQE